MLFTHLINMDYLTRGFQEAFRLLVTGDAGVYDIVGVSLLVALAATLLAACQPTIKIEAPREPITINLNIKLDADIRLKIEEQAKEDVATNPIF